MYVRTIFWRNREGNHNYPWVVGFNGREIIYTGHHGITDGMGATAFMRTVFPDEMLAENQEECAIHNFAINLSDIKKKSKEYGVTQFAVIATYVAQAICSILPGTDNVVMMNIISI